MSHGAPRALEFDRIAAAVRRLALTPLGSARLAELRPAADVRQAASQLAATSEGVKFSAESSFPLDAPSDLDAILNSLAVEGRALEPPQLLGLARFFASVDVACNAVRRARGHYPALKTIAESASSFADEAADIHRKIAPSGEIADDATPHLRAIRERLRKQRTRLRSTLESYLRGKDTSRYLQEQVVTDRAGRFVLVVKAEHRSSIPGIVHGSSASGASLYLEPLSTVEINNDIVALEQQEAEEILRILLALTDAFRRRALELQRTLNAAGELDVIQAKARFAHICDAVEPKLAQDGRLELRGARHPLLIPGVRELLDEPVDEAVPEGGAPRPVRESSGPVPVDILLIPPTRVLIISGPNTGGKTVALKSAGLFALMAQSGLHVPAENGSQITVFRSVFADIGDEQSIAASLSTFSWHITNIASMDRSLALPALVLLDEIGAGTDPNEGGALGTAVIDHFRQRGALVVATTHYDALKSYASTTQGVEIAAFGFDPETFAPTYRLVYGSPGRSLALEIAARLGIPTPIIDAARAYRSERETQLAEHLARMERDLNTLDHERRLAARERAALAEAMARMQSREEELRRREEAFRERLHARVEDRLRDARREIDDVVRDLRQRTAALANAPRHIPAVSTGETGALRAEARAALDIIEQRLKEDASGEGAPRTATVASSAAPAEVGDTVAVGAFGFEGTVQHLDGDVAEVDVRGKRMRVAVADLRVIARASARAAAGQGRVSVQVEASRRDDLIPGDLNVIGCTTDEALSRAEKFLDDAVMQDRRVVRFIHGHGTGQLRRAIGAFLASHPLVAHHGPAPDDQGGTAITIAELKD
jgi:DNA mismatch repair protein MutS2